MSKLLTRFWNDDEGAIISVELILVLGVLIFGIVPGLVALRNSVIAALTNIGNALSGVVINVAVDGITVTGAGLGPQPAIAYTGGWQITQGYGQQLTTVGGPSPSPFTFTPVPVAPPPGLTVPATTP
jgi:Flp pilus assembly pilin Flp